VSPPGRGEGHTAVFIGGLANPEPPSDSGAAVGGDEVGGGGARDRLAPSVAHAGTARSGSLVETTSKHES
jgi:hypothetical protein